MMDFKEFDTLSSGTCFMFSVRAFHRALRTDCADAVRLGIVECLRRYAVRALFHDETTGTMG